MRIALLFFLLVWLLPTAARASDIGIAMHGTPKYAAGFDHLDYVNPDAPKGGELKLSRNGSFNNLNNHVITGNNAEGLEYINDKLMQRVWDEPFTMYGVVAESIDVAPDRSWITFHLRKEARFHDGVAITAEDVKFSYEMYRAHGHPVRRRVYGLITDVRIADPRTITFTFGPGYDHECVMILAMMPVLPKHYWETEDASKTTLKPPLGSGPYKIVSVDPGRKVVFERVKDYWGRDLPVNRGQYNFDTITYSYFRDDDISLQSFKAGNYNFRREFDVAKWETRYDFQALSEGRVIREEIPHHRPEWLKALVFNQRRELFADRRVRQALSYMFNDAWLDKNLSFGKLKRIGSAFPNSDLAASGKPRGEELRILKQYKADLPPEVFGAAWMPPGGDPRGNKRRAIALLKEAGWVYRDEKLVNGKGEAFSFELLLGDPADEKIAMEFARDLAKAGIAARVRTVDNAQFVGRLDDYDYDMVAYRWINSLSPGNEQVNYWGRKSAETKGARNYAGVTNAAVDALADSIGRSADRATLIARCRALDRALMWGYYMIPLFYLGKDLVAHTTDIHRPSVTPTYGVVLESWWSQEGDKRP
ncbi:MAG: ABC transporter substrate-binding protein [Alphaproteobacteria bacterium]|nr:MAG: ABC transporter substrate-binding protein [Alphaproteobacteria bacterium]